MLCRAFGVPMQAMYTWQGGSAEEGCLSFALVEDLPLGDEEWERLFEKDDDFSDEDNDGYDRSEWN